MMIVVQFEFPGEPFEKYERGVEAGGDAVRNAPGRLHHVAYETSDGWGVVDVWESEDAFARFGEVLGPVFQQVGLSGEPKIYPARNVMT